MAIEKALETRVALLEVSSKKAGGDTEAAQRSATTGIQRLAADVRRVLQRRLVRQTAHARHVRRSGSEMALSCVRYAPMVVQWATIWLATFQASFARNNQVVAIAALVLEACLWLPLLWRFGVRRQWRRCVLLAMCGGHWEGSRTGVFGVGCPCTETLRVPRTETLLVESLGPHPVALATTHSPSLLVLPHPDPP